MTDATAREPLLTTFQLSKHALIQTAVLQPLLCQLLWQDMV